MDEMDLMKKLRDVPSPRTDAYDSARAALHTAMAEPVSTVVRPKRWLSWPKVSVAAVGAAAVAAAVVMGTTGTSTPTGDPIIAAPQVVDSALVKLASDVKAAGTLSGDSSLVITTKTAPDGSPYLVYTVYTDKGQVFHGDSAKTLQAAAAKGDDAATQYDANVMAAARLAATGDVEKAKIAMVNASPNGLGLGLSPAEQEKAWAQNYEVTAKMLREIGKQVPDFKPRPTGKELEDVINNRLWSHTTYALFIGAANADIRAGVLKLVATIQDVTIGKAQVDDQSALTLTAGPSLQGGESTHVVTINADTGLPIRSEVFPVKDGKPSAARYKSSRVNLADVVAGKI
ncbi:hypothetical protein SK803_12435 [Lentzea sp. BCCO 10_0856]|uniref:Uncharacterized protein n=1 Tax=Lentzea miocenica TaxID=3095431 RepID=A0ABU4SZ94_9PSEU|nr:hypothetical protein [Lentzea sp. BCCO 10_0856]MDX8031028.1 hypothetical protein [Lentzea sp. BCCO 10_0856]